MLYGFGTAKEDLCQNRKEKYFGKVSVRALSYVVWSTSVDANTIDTGDWCEITYQNNAGNFLSLDCYELGTFDITFLMRRMVKIQSC